MSTQSRKFFYDLCDELGIAVFQDSEYNWTHPSTDEWAQRFADVYRENVKLLKHHPSLICWIIMNEPGCIGSGWKCEKEIYGGKSGTCFVQGSTEDGSGQTDHQGFFLRRRSA